MTYLWRALAIVGKLLPAAALFAIGRRLHRLADEVDRRG